MKRLIVSLGFAAALSACYRAPARTDAAQMSLWADEENHKIQALEFRIGALEAQSRQQATDLADLQAVTPGAKRVAAEKAN